MNAELARAQKGFGAETVVMDDLSGEQPGDGLQADVRMRRDVHGLLVGKAERAVAVEKAPRADHAALAHGQDAADAQVSEVGFVRRVSLQDPG
ncbi:MAG: hypothetical protein QM757_38480 [Paludibaculum sp.]